MTYTRCTVILALSIAALLSAASANEKDNEAKTLAQKASDLSDIRKEGAPPFRLKANLRITNDDGSVVEGVYTEFWISNAQWRKEMVLGDFRRTQVAMGRKSWTLDSSSIVPNRIADLETPFDLWTLRLNPWKTDKFEDQQVDGIAARCFRTKREMWGVSELCFDKTSGSLLAKMDPVRVKNKTVDGTCIYRDYQRFGDRLVATSYQCFEDKKVRLQAKVGELTMRPDLDQTLFAPLSGGKESAHCLSHPQPPTVIQPAPAVAPRKGDAMVTLSLLVGTDGKPREVQVVGSVDNDYDEAALEAVRQWRFKPASCEGQPIEVKIAVEIDFHYR
jgi:TonB family protein